MTDVPLQFSETTLYLSNSELSTFRECRRKWWLSYYRRLVSRFGETSGPRNIGTNVHLALSAYYNDQLDPLDVLAELKQENLSRVPEGDVAEMGKVNSEADLARIMVEGYMQWLEETGADQGLVVVANEERVAAALPVEDQYLEGTRFDSVSAIAKLDLRMLREADGWRFFVDHKTVGGFADLEKRAHMGTQLLHYELLEYMHAVEIGAVDPSSGKPVTDGGLLNMLRKVKRTARATPPFYERLEVRHNVHEMRSYWMRLWGETIEILRVYRELDSGSDPRAVAYPNPTKDCSWKCDFFAVCPMFDDGSAAERMVDDYFIAGDPLARYQEEEPRED